MYNRRIKTITKHLESSISDDPSFIVLGEDKELSSNINAVDVAKLKEFLDGKEYVKYKDQVRQFLKETPSYRENVSGLPMAEYRELVFQQIKDISKSGLFHITTVRDSVDIACALMEILSTYNNNVVTKLGVHYSLFGGTILLLGTERHEKYIPLANNLDIVGCFSMTEVGHGSNVRGLETTATYDHSTQEFVIHSPTPSSHKFWIGGAYLHAHYTTVFARLILDKKDHGIHAFIVPIRDIKTMKEFPGVTIRDCGPKLGLNGIDNGHIKFDNVRIPRDNLLNRYSDVTEEGKYVSKFQTPIKNFAATMAPFLGGRIYICKNTAGAIHTSLTIAIRYAHYRRQFGPNSNIELPLMTIPSHQRRLMIPLARTITMDMYLKTIAAQIKSNKPSTHAHSAGIKAVYTWHGIATLQVCRESCGGQGYRSANRIAEFKSDCDINVTYEGDNTVLMQQVAKYIMTKSEQPAPAIRIDGDAKKELFNFSNLLRLFRARELLKTEEAKQIVQEGGSDLYAAFNSSIPWAIKASFSHMEYIILENAVQAMNSQVVEPIPQLVLLDTLSKIEDDLGWFVSNNLISRDAAKSVPYLVMDLCEQVSKHSLDIVNAFAIPKKCLPSDNLQDGIFN